MYREALIRNTYQAMVYEEPDGKSTTLAENHPAYMRDRDVYRNKNQQPNTLSLPDNNDDISSTTNETNIQLKNKLSGQNDSTPGLSSVLSNYTSKNDRVSQRTSTGEASLIGNRYGYRNNKGDESVASWADEDGDSFYDDIGLGTDTCEMLIAQAVQKSLNSSSLDDELTNSPGKRNIITPNPLSGEKEGQWRHVSKGKGRGQQRSFRNRNKGYPEKPNTQTSTSGRFDALASFRKTRK
eukprot:Tbor_TRINITY_DN2230_c0_g2::TRINITY_DN2230_c0_g2_i1::g.2733::m.2733